MKLTLLLLASFASSVAAQGLPPPSRTVYKCEDQKKVYYSDSPCLGARKIDVEPTRGLNKSTGREQTGQDVQREKQNELMADALRPVINETPEQRATRHRRFTLEPAAQSECTRLDSEIPKLEQEERDATKQALLAVQRRLLASRARFRDLRC